MQGIAAQVSTENSTGEINGAIISLADYVGAMGPTQACDSKARELSYILSVVESFISKNAPENPKRSKDFIAPYAYPLLRLGQTIAGTADHVGEHGAEEKIILQIECEALALKALAYEALGDKQPSIVAARLRQTKVSYGLGQKMFADKTDLAGGLNEILVKKVEALAAENFVAPTTGEEGLQILQGQRANDKGPRA